MRAVWDILIVALLIGVNALLAMSEIALVSANRTRLAALESRGEAGASGARLLAERPDRFIPVLQAGVTLVGVLLGVFGGDPLAHALQPYLARIAATASVAGSVALVLSVLVVTLLTLLLGELVPKQLTLRAPERFAMLLARPVRALTAIGWPLVWVLSAASHLVLRSLGAGTGPGEDVTEEELKVLLAEGERSGVIETEERDMIERVLRLADKPARAIMTPRTELVWIDRTDSEPEILRTIASSPQSRFVVCDGRVDNVVGVVRAKDVLAQKVGGSAVDLAAVLARPIVIPDTITALDALERFRDDELGLALVLDEYGSFEGVVTATDVLDAIVGDPEDAAPAADTPEGEEARELLLDGLMPVDEAKARLVLPALPAEGQYHTLGGLLLALLRRVPRVGDRIVFGGWQFEVVAMDGRRVERVRASREDEAPSPSGG
ncbi:MAG: HlyC/CorC family transporter [Rhodospirillales bacterium]|nr:HlyC/CorC family transporter [Rhodospirillales bacterium]